MPIVFHSLVMHSVQTEHFFFHICSVLFLILFEWNVNAKSKFYKSLYRYKAETLCEWKILLDTVGVNMTIKINNSLSLSLSLMLACMHMLTYTHTQMHPQSFFLRNIYIHAYKHFTNILGQWCWTKHQWCWTKRVHSVTEQRNQLSGKSTPTWVKSCTHHIYIQNYWRHKAQQILIQRKVVSKITVFHKFCYHTNHRPHWNDCPHINTSCMEAYIFWLT